MKVSDLEIIEDEITPEVARLRGLKQKMKKYLENGRACFEKAASIASGSVDFMESENSNLLRVFDKRHDDAVKAAEKNNTTAPEKGTFTPIYSDAIIEHFKQEQTGAVALRDKVKK